MLDKSQWKKFKDIARDVETGDDADCVDDRLWGAGEGQAGGKIEMTQKGVVTPRWAWFAFFVAMAVIAYFSSPNWIARFIAYLWLTVPICWWARRQVKKRLAEKPRS